MSHHLSPSVMRLISAVCTAAAALIIAAVVVGNGEHPGMLAILTLLVIVTEVFDFQPYPNTRISITIALIIAAATLSSLTGVVIVCLAAAITDFAAHRKPPEKAIFNFAALILAGATYVGILEAFSPNTRDWGETVWPALLGSLAAYAVNSGLVAFAISLDGGENAVGVWHEFLTWVLPYYLLMGVIGASIAVAHRNWGFEATALGAGLCLPAWLALRFHVMRFITPAPA